jgi:hypothetical protein
LVDFRPFPLHQQQYVDIRNEVTNKIRLMNPFDYEIQVNQNTVVGEAEKFESPPTTLFTVEDSDEIKNFMVSRSHSS